MTLISQVFDALQREQATNQIVKFTIDYNNDRIIVTEILKGGSPINHKLIRQADDSLVDRNGFHITNLDDFEDWFVYTFYML